MFHTLDLLCDLILNIIHIIIIYPRYIADITKKVYNFDRIINPFFFLEKKLLRRKLKENGAAAVSVERT